MIAERASCGLMPGLCLALAILASCGASEGNSTTSDSTAEAAQPARDGAPRPWFVEEAAARGIDFLHVSGHRERFYIPEIVGGGAAMIDFDQDGWLDIYLVQSGSLYDADAPLPSNRLYRNRGDGTFIDVTPQSGTGDTGYGIGVAVGDFDNDGFPDLYITNVGPNVLYRNRGDGSFEDVSRAAGVDDAGFGASAAFFDADHDGFLDLIVLNYLVWTKETERRCLDDRGRPDYCMPAVYNAPASDVLYRNRGDGTFEDVSRSSGIADRPGTGLGVVCSDFTNDGRIDIFVANDGMPDHLWINHGNWKFTEEAMQRGCAVDQEGKAKAGMGVLAADITGNGYEDILVCNLMRESDSFFRNQAGYFTDITSRSGLAAPSRSFTRWGVGAHDFDHDGSLDIFIANGRVARIAPLHTDDPYAEPNILLRGGRDGRFQQVDPLGGVVGVTAKSSRAAAFGDIDNDGAIDIVIVNRDGRAHLLRNVAASGQSQGEGNWIIFRVLTEHGRDAYNARLMLDVEDDTGKRTIVREVRSAYSYAAASDARVHIGLGKADRVTNVRVRWREGDTETFGDFEAGRVITLHPASKADPAVSIEP